MGWGPASIVNFDTISSLDNLIKKLALPWELVETGKGYWIGYTDDMYSIARHRNNAIKPLMNFIDTATSTKARMGAVLALHLVGIESKIAGRFFEKFVDTLAREALLYYLNDDSLHDEVVSLLKRDPWLSDIPPYMDYLSRPCKDYSAVLSALIRYDVPNRPFGQEIPEFFEGKKMQVRTEDGYVLDPTGELMALRSEFGNIIQVDEEITSLEEWQDLQEKSKSNSINIDTMFVVTAIEFLGRTIFSYCCSDYKFFYNVKENNTLEFFGPIKARQIWLDWWNMNQDHLNTNTNKQDE